MRRAMLQLVLITAVGAVLASVAARAVGAPETSKARVRVTLIRWPYT